MRVFSFPISKDTYFWIRTLNDDIGNFKIKLDKKQVVITPNSNIYDKIRSAMREETDFIFRPEHFGCMCEIDVIYYEEYDRYLLGFNILKEDKCIASCSPGVSFSKIQTK